MHEQLKIGILGCANIAERMVLPEILTHGNYNLSGVASRSKEKAKRYAATFDTRAFSSYDDLIAADIDVVYIPLPNSLHFKWAKIALLSGKHVIVEKPLCSAPSDVLELCEIASKRGLVLFENFQFRFHSQLSFIKDFLASEEFGEIRNVRSSFGFPPFNDENNIRYSKYLDGGSLLDAGAYTVKIAQLILGSDLRVACAKLKLSENLGVDLWGSATLFCRNSDVVAQLAFGFDNVYQNQVEVWGSKAKITAKRIFTAGPNVIPTVEVVTAQNIYTQELPSDNHFSKMLSHVYKLTRDPDLREAEYVDNIRQANLLNSIKEATIA